MGGGGGGGRGERGGNKHSYSSINSWSVESRDPDHTQHLCPLTYEVKWALKTNNQLIHQPLQAPTGLSWKLYLLNAPPPPTPPPFPTKKDRFRERGNGYGFGWTEHTVGVGLTKKGWGGRLRRAASTRTVVARPSLNWCCRCHVTPFWLLIVICMKNQRWQINIVLKCCPFDIKGVCVCVCTRGVCVWVSQCERACIYAYMRACMCVFTGILNTHRLHLCTHKNVYSSTVVDPTYTHTHTQTHQMLILNYKYISWNYCLQFLDNTWLLQVQRSSISFKIKTGTFT